MTVQTQMANPYAFLFFPQIHWRTTLQPEVGVSETHSILQSSQAEAYLIALRSREVETAAEEKEAGVGAPVHQDGVILASRLQMA